MALESVGGRQTFFGALPSKNKYGAEKHGAGSIKEIVIEFSYDDLPAVDADNEMLATIPASAKVVAADLQVGTAWVGGTNITIGTSQADGGGVIDADGLLAAVLTAALTADSNHAGGGADIGEVSSSERQAITATTTGTFTAGDAILVVQYQDKL
jgi:hypothetical protein